MYCRVTIHVFGSNVSTFAFQRYEYRQWTCGSISINSRMTQNPIAGLRPFPFPCTGVNPHHLWPVRFYGMIEEHDLNRLECIFFPIIHLYYPPITFNIYPLASHISLWYCSDPLSSLPISFTTFTALLSQPQTHPS